MARMNILRTLYFNLRAFGWRGLKLPVYVYGCVKVYNIGRIELHCPVRRALWLIGMNQSNTSQPYTIFDNRGTIELHGRAWLHHGCRLTNSGTIVFHGNDIISHECVMDIRERLEFGRNVSVGFGSEFTDSDMHFMVDVERREVQPNRKPIHIGDFNWLGSHTYVKKGTRTPECTTVASPCAVLLRDYTADTPPCSILAGAPARVVGHGKRRVLNFKNEASIRHHFQQGETVPFSVPADADLDVFCGL